MYCGFGECEFVILYVFSRSFSSYAADLKRGVLKGVPALYIPGNGGSYKQGTVYAYCTCGWSISRS